MKIRNKVGVFGMLAIFLLTVGSTVMAQERNRGDFKGKGIQFTDAQKAEMKEIRLEHAKATKDLKNELNELQARKKTLMSAEVPNTKAIYTNIDKCSSINNKLAKEKVMMRLDMLKLMTEEQKMKAANRAQMMKGKKHAHAKMKKGHGKHAKGQMHKRGGEYGKGKPHKAKMQRHAEKRNFLDLTDAQKEQMKEMRMAHKKESQELRNQLEEIRLKQKHLMTAEQPDERSILANVDRLSDVHSKLAKMKVDHQLEARKILNDEQLTLFLSRPQMGKKHGKAHRGF